MSRPSIAGDLGMSPVPATWWEPEPGTRAHAVRTGVRWAFWATVSAASVGFLWAADYLGYMTAQ